MDIDKIMEMLDWNQPIEVQQKGLELARKVKCINVFLQPGSHHYGKNVWNNCAKILCEKSDDELRPCLDGLFEWLRDMNWPGYFDIYNRLMNCHDSCFNMSYNTALIHAKAENDEFWEMNLIELKKERDKKI